MYVCKLCFQISCKSRSLREQSEIKRNNLCIFRSCHIQLRIQNQCVNQSKCEMYSLFVNETGTNNTSADFILRSTYIDISLVWLEVIYFSFTDSHRSSADVSVFVVCGWWTTALQVNTPLSSASLPFCCSLKMIWPQNRWWQSTKLSKGVNK